jgi:hypothetical protein
MSDRSSELVEILRFNGNLKQNYGKLIGAYLFLHSINAVRRPSYFWRGLLFAIFSAGLAWLQGHGAPVLHAG